MKIGMSSAVHYGYLETESAAAALRGCGLDTCEVFLETWSEYTADFGQRVRESLGGLPCTSVHAKGTQFEPDLFGLSQRQREDAFHILDGVLAAGERLGASYYVFHGPGNINTVRHPETMDRLLETMGRMDETAAKHGMAILWENVNWCALRSPEDVAQARRLRPEQRFVLDLKQAMRAGQDPFAMLRAMGERLAHLHVMDWDESGTLCLPGEGVVDFRRLRGELGDMGYAGAVILEPYAIHGRDPERLQRSIDFLRETMA